MRFASEPVRAAPPGPLVIVAPSLGGGGAERQLAWLAARWFAAGGAVTVVTLAAEESDVWPLAPGVERIALALASPSRHRLAGAWATAGRLRALRRTIRAIAARSSGGVAPLVVVAFTVATNVLTAFATRGLGVRLVLAERQHPPHAVVGSTWRRLRPIACRMADRVTTQTERSARWLERHASARRVAVIPNALSLPLPRLVPIVAPADILPPDARLVLAAGRLRRQKGFDVLLAAVATLPADVHVLIAGAGDDTALRHTAGALGVDERVHLPGRIGNLGDFYRRASAFVLSSRHEGFPNVLAEAMAAGLPVVATRCETGPEELIEHECDGLLVPVDDSDAMAAAIRRVLDDPGLARRLGARALTVADRLDERRVFARWRAVLEG